MKDVHGSDMRIVRSLGEIGYLCVLLRLVRNFDVTSEHRSPGLYYVENPTDGFRL